MLLHLSFRLPRFWTSQYGEDVPKVPCHKELWTETCCYCPLSGIKPCSYSTTLSSPNPDVHLSPFPHSALTQVVLILLTSHLLLLCFWRSSFSQLTLLWSNWYFKCFLVVSVFRKMSIRCQLPFGRRTKLMLKSLFAEFRTGLYFTRFCEQSGNQVQAKSWQGARHGCWPYASHWSFVCPLTSSMC